jgi:hypothetical protein
VAERAAPVVVRLTVGTEQASDAQTEQMTAALFEELSQLPDIAVTRSSSEVMPGTKSGAIAQSGELVVSFLGGGGLTGLVAALKVWTSRDKDRSAELHLASGESVRITGATREQQDRIIDKLLGTSSSDP